MASFRLAALYLALFTASALALGAFVYFSVRREILTDFDERIAEELDALKTAFVDGGRDRLQGNRIWNSAATLAGFCVSGEMDFTGSRMIRGAGECFGSLYRMLERFGRPSHWQCGAA